MSLPILSSIAITNFNIFKKIQKIIYLNIFLIFFAISVEAQSEKVSNKTTTNSENTTPSGTNAKTESAEEEKNKDQCGYKLMDKVTLLTAFSFDFDNTVTPNYYAKLNLDHKRKDKRFAFLTGITRTKFSFEDTTNHKYMMDNVLLSPFKTSIGDKALRKFHKYTSTRTVKAYSFYFQPSWKLGNKSTCEGIYLQAHLELLVNRASIRTNLSTLGTDTIEILDSDGAPENFSFLESNILERDFTTAGGYFGAGIYLKYNLFNEKNKFFFQNVYGIATEGILWTSKELESKSLHLNSPKGLNSSTDNFSTENFTFKNRGFYFFRSEYRYSHSEDAQLMVGFESRGLLLSEPPLHSAYVGLNVSVSGLLKLVGVKEQ
ncbi:MAG: hypothetical protein IPN79_12880 [Saprospiraceae bacterium]|nr:hypothetical protein [Saprospiraceae bacterium]